MKKQKDKTYAFRVSSGDLNRIKSMAERAKMTVTDYLTACALKKKIVVIDGLDTITKELKAQGKNLNQLTIQAHINQLYPTQIDRLADRYGDIYSMLEALVREVM